MTSDQVYIATMKPTPVSGPSIKTIPRIFDEDLDAPNGGSIYHLYGGSVPHIFVIDLGGSIPVNTLELSTHIEFIFPFKFIFTLEQGDPWNDGGTKDFSFSIAMSEGGPFTEVLNFGGIFF